MAEVMNEEFYIWSILIMLKNNVRCELMLPPATPMLCT